MYLNVLEGERGVKSRVRINTRKIRSRKLTRKSCLNQQVEALMEENKRLEIMLRSQDKMFLVNNLIPGNTYEYKYIEQHHRKNQSVSVEFRELDSFSGVVGLDNNPKKCCSRCNSELPYENRSDLSSLKIFVSSSEDPCN